MAHVSKAPFHASPIHIHTPYHTTQAHNSYKMSSYNTEIKTKSPMKQTINTFLGTYAKPTTKALVIDAETLLSSSTLVSCGVDPLNIVVLNDDTTIIEKAHRAGHLKSTTGISSAVLPRLEVEQYDIVYLDYCGFPDVRSDGFNPAYDILWCGDRLADDGIMVVTFSRRATNCVEKAETMIPVSLELVKTICYSETCAMFAMILTKGGSNPRAIRDRFNRIKLDVHKRKREEDDEAVNTLLLLTEQPAAKKRKSSWKDTYDQLVKERMKHAYPEKYSLIAYYWEGRLSPGIVERKSGKRRRVLWVDHESPVDYGVAEGYFPFGKHINIADPDHDKSNYNWTYYYDTFEVVSEADMLEIKNLPIQMQREHYLQVKQRIQSAERKKEYPVLASYFGVKLA